MKIRAAFLLLPALLGLFVAGCASPETRIKANLDTFNRLPPAQQDMIKKGRIDIGFTAEMVHLAIGEPDHIRLHTDAHGTSEIWVYTVWETADGGVLYRGWYHRGLGSYYPYYPYYLEAPARRERDHFMVTFKDGRVVAIDAMNK